MSKLRKIIDEAKENNLTEVDLVDRNIVNLVDLPSLCKLSLYNIIMRFHASF